MAKRVYLDERICARARDKMEQLLDGTSDKGVLIQQRAAQALMSACQNQERYGLNPQTPADFARASLKRGGAQELAALTPEKLAEYQQQMTGDYPGKPS
jgi:hypothetical protein